MGWLKDKFKGLTGKGIITAVSPVMGIVFAAQDARSKSEAEKAAAEYEMLAQEEKYIAEAEKADAESRKKLIPIAAILAIIIIVVIQTRRK
jgi:Na+/H+ antiporter NhaC